MTALIDPFSLATGYEILKIAKREGWLRHPIDLFRKKNRVLLLGSTGAGKSQFLKSVPEIVSTAIPQAARTEFPTIARFEINVALFDFGDTPGQREHRPVRDEVTKNAIKRNLSGVVNFVSYGYHEYGAPRESVFLEEIVRPEYLAEHREREVSLLAEWAPLLSTEWVLTVVTKADIWWDNKQEVAEYYDRGKYRDRLRELFPNAISMVRPYSSISHRFYGTLPSASTFDDTVRSACRQELFRLLREAIDRNKRSK